MTTKTALQMILKGVLHIDEEGKYTQIGELRKE
jgi:hypothetical protein